MVDLNLTSKIVLNRVPKKFYQPKTAVDRIEPVGFNRLVELFLRVLQIQSCSRFRHFGPFHRTFRLSVVQDRNTYRHTQLRVEVIFHLVPIIPA